MAMTDKERQLKTLQTSIRNLMTKANRLHDTIESKQHRLSELRKDILRLKEQEKQLKKETNK